MEYVIRFFAGGLIVSLFAMIGDILRPKSFAGLFGAAPSAALVSLTLAFWNHDAAYVSIEGRSMILGAIAFAVYSFLVCQLLMRVRCSTLTATSTAIVAWLLWPSASSRFCWARSGRPFQVLLCQRQSLV